MGQLNEVNENQVLPKMEALARIADFKRTKTNTGKLVYVMELRLTDTGDGRYVKAPVWVRFFIGTDKDPDGKLTPTWKESIAARDMKRLFKKLGLDTTKEVDDLIVEAEDQEIGISLGRRMQPMKIKRKNPDGSFREEDNQYGGQWENRVNGYWTPGERAPQIAPDEEETAHEPVAGASGTAAKPSVEEDALPSPKAAKPVVSEAGNGAESGNGHDASAEESAKAEESANGSNGSNLKVVGKKEKELPCQAPGCGQMIPKSQMLNHLEEHAAA